MVSCDSVAGEVRCESGSSGGLKNNFDTKLYISESGEYDCSLAGLLQIPIMQKNQSFFWGTLRISKTCTKAF